MLEESESLVENSLHPKIPFLFLVLLGLGIVGGGIYFWWTPQSRMENTPHPVRSTSTQFSSSSIFVDINGAVVTPGLYRFSLPVRLADVLERAGGLKPGADLQYVAEKLDLARKVKDEEKIYIPFKGQSIVPISQQEAVNPDLLSVNTATLDQLQNLPGISLKRATLIVHSRPFVSLDEFQQKLKLPAKSFQKIVPLISL